MNTRLLGVLYSTTVFVSSAMLLVLEIVAGRLLAPYVGVSLYTWTAIIGVILAGLSLGNWLGGTLADKGYGHKATGLVLVFSALSAVLILPLLAQIARQIQQVQLDLATASLFYVLGLFFIPAVMIGVITPLVTTLYLAIDQRTGKIVGRMHALAALGSILGTFATGLLLVQWIGTRNIVLLVALTLFLFALPFLLLTAKKRMLIIASVIAFCATLAFSIASPGFANPCDTESSYYCLRVVDENDGTGNTFARTLILDHMVHSTNVRDDPAQLVTPYIQVMDSLIDRHFSDRQSLHYFFAGGGAYTHPRSIASRFADAEITVSEIDPAVTATARSALFLDPEDMQIIHADTRNVLRNSRDGSFDVVITDVFHDVAIPYHLTTLEHVSLIRQKLSEEGIYLANVIDVFPQNRLVMSMQATLSRVFPYVSVWIAPPAEESTRLTYVITASGKAITEETLELPPEMAGTWYQVSDFINQQIEQGGAPVLTDDFAPVERLLGPLFTTPAGI